MIKAILFDFDGTIVDSLPFYLQAYDKVLKKFGFNFNDKDIVKNCFSKTEKTVCQNLNISDVRGFKDAYFHGARLFSKKVKLFSGVIEVLKLAKKNQIKLAITSFAYRWYVDNTVKRLDLKKYFDLILGADDVENLKPHPEIAIKACQKLSIPPTSALMVGDSKGDILAGKAADCKTALFFPKNYKLFYNLADLKKANPDYVFGDFEDLKLIITKI